MVERIYFSLWGLLVLITAFVYMTGLLDTMTVFLLGLVMFGLVFMGMIGVLPFWSSHHTEPSH